MARFSPRYLILGLAIAAVLAAGLSWLSRLPFWAALAIVVVAMVVNSLLLRWEDNQPGGFNRPGE